MMNLNGTNFTISVYIQKICASCSCVFLIHILSSSKSIKSTAYLAIIRRRRSPGDYSTIFTEPGENNCFSITAQGIIRAIVFFFSFYLFLL